MTKNSGIITWRRWGVTAPSPLRIMSPRYISDEHPASPDWNDQFVYCSSFCCQQRVAFNRISDHIYLLLSCWQIIHLLLHLCAADGQDQGNLQRQTGRSDCRHGSGGESQYDCDGYTWHGYNSAYDNGQCQWLCRTSCSLPCRSLPPSFIKSAHWVRLFVFGCALSRFSSGVGLADFMSAASLFFYHNPTNYITYA